MITAIYVLAFACNLLLELFIRRVNYPKDKEPPPPFLPRWKQGEELMIFISPGYWFARYFKNKIDYFESYRVKVTRRRFFVANNKCNLCMTVALSLIGLFLSASESHCVWTVFVSAIVLSRYISRTVEISYAFGKDATGRTMNRSGINKFTRLRLSLCTYTELFILSAPVYYLYLSDMDKCKALLMALSVGTLANVGYAFPVKHSPYVFFVFFQIFATLSLVLLSLASYISREK